jgi:hypothetical protein
MFEFPPEFPFVSGRKPSVAAAPAEIPPEPAALPPEPTEVAPETQSEPIRPISWAETPRPAPVAVPASASVPSVPQAERRKLKRDALATAALLRIDGIPGPSTKIELMDISVAGARFRSPRKLDVGEKAQIRVEAGPFRWTTRLRIVHCTPLEGGFASIGCAFQRTELLRPWPAAA